MTIRTALLLACAVNYLLLSFVLIAMELFWKGPR